MVGFIAAVAFGRSPLRAGLAGKEISSLPCRFQDELWAGAEPGPRRTTPASPAKGARRPHCQAAQREPRRARLVSQLRGSPPAQALAGARWGRLWRASAHGARRFGRSRAQFGFASFSRPAGPSTARHPARAREPTCG